jgi:DNA-binding beta-propeller fold protein YncE
MAPCGGCGDNLAVGSDALWFPLGSGFGVARIDPTTNTVTATTPLTIVALRVFADADGVWVAGGRGGLDQGAQVIRLDPATAAISTRVAAPYALNAAVAPSGGDLWVGSAQVIDSGTISRLKLGG